MVGTKSLKKRVIIYVIGEIGHSPRMCYHASSFSLRGWDVEVCGYAEDEIPKVLLKDPNVTIHRIPVLKRGPRENKLLFMIKKVVYQFYVISKQLWELRGSNYLLMQNPPSIPIMPLAVLYRLSGCMLIIDWHNLAYSILQLKFKGNFKHPFVLISYVLEYLCSKFANYHLVVTDAMKQYLVNSFGIKADKIALLYDRPAPQFIPLQKDESREKLLKQPFIESYIPKGFDVSKGDKVIVTSTSFTPDEDITILLSSLKQYEKEAQKNDKLPNILCFITGKGPMKAEIMHNVEKDKEEKLWKKVSIQFVWLKSEDYPKLLRLCDFGVSLHMSSSGLDLPMKILDMFGSGIPVFALDYPVLNELVKEGKNGLKFKNSTKLNDIMLKTIQDQKLNDSITANARKESKVRWNSSWEPSMKKLGIIS